MALSRLSTNASATSLDLMLRIALQCVAAIKLLRMSGRGLSSERLLEEEELMGRFHSAQGTSGRNKLSAIKVDTRLQGDNNANSN
jgi:hypothetical protein